jgi:4-amino-4-deoxy-L-arabinose transferase-like glycosyltransferase
VTADAFLTRHRRWIILAIVVLSVLVRLACRAETADGPYHDSARTANTDMRFFDDWGREIASGDWLGSRPLHPMHDWHRQIAAIRLFEHLGQEPSDPEGMRRLWDDWYGGTRFHQEPLYPYSIAVTYRLLGNNPHAVYLWQMLLGVLSNLLIYFIARRSFSDSVAVVAAVMAIGCGPLLFYETVLLRSASITFLGLLAVFVTQSALDRGSRSRYFLAGLCAGLAVLLKSTLVLLGLGAMVLVIWRERRHPRVALGRAALLAAGMAACLLPVTLRNVAVYAPAFSLSSVGAVTFYGANFDGNDPGQGFQISLDEAAEILGRTEGRTLPTILATLRTHPHPGSWLTLCARKLGAAWHGYEIPNNVNYYAARKYSRVLPLLPISFTWIGPLALAGLLAAAWTRRGSPMLYLLVLAHLLPLLILYVLSRFRAPLLAALIPFAAAALVWLVQWLLERRWRPAALLGALVILTALWTASPRSTEAGPQIRLSDMVMLLDNWFQPAVQRAQEAGDTQEVARLTAEALRLEPPAIELLLRGDRPLEPHDERYLRLFSMLNMGAARAHQAAEYDDEAARLQERARALERLAREFAVEETP